jgi:DNA-binding winged helix-turn-helix (wHTH) protein/TolB-like protein/tetratricopeptide (TPR) repeat protein
MAANNDLAVHDKRVFEFGPYRLDTAERILLRSGQPVTLTAKAFDILSVLIRNHGHLVTKDELMKEVWPDSFVEDNNLTVNISGLRKALGEGASGHPYIETVPRRGYRFVEAVQEIPAESGAAPTQVPVSEQHEARQKSDIPAFHEEVAGNAPYGLVSSSANSFRSWRPVVLTAAVLVVVLALGIWYFRSGGQAITGTVALAPKSIAVLPFKTVGAAGSDELLGLGMADALITRLSAPGSMIIRPTGSVLKYYGSEKDVLVAGRELQVDAVMDGTILKSGDRVRVTARLLRVHDGTALWTKTFDEQWTNIFAVQDLISDRLARLLVPHLTRKEPGLLKTRETENPLAYQFYFKGLVFWDKRTEEGLRTAIDYFGKAIESDPTYALAYAGLADSYLNLATYGVLPANEAYSRAKAAALKALERDNTLAEPYATLGMVTLYYDWDWPSAEREFKQAIEQKPDSATAHQRYALGLMRMGRFEEATVEIKKAEVDDPLSQIIGANVGQVLYHARRYDEAIAELQKRLQVRPGFWLAHRILGEAYLQKGMYAEAIAEMKEAMRLGGGPPVQGELGYACAVSGNKDQAIKILGELIGLSRQRYVSPFAIALVHVGLGNKDQALEWLNKSYEERSRWLMTMKIDPMLDSLRTDPRFVKLLAQIGLSNN